MEATLWRSCPSPTVQMPKSKKLYCLCHYCHYKTCGWNQPVFVLAYKWDQLFQSKFCMRTSVCWNILLCGLPKDNWHFEGPFHLYNLILKIEVTYHSVTSVDFQRTTWYYFSQDRRFRNHHCENLKYVRTVWLLNFSPCPIHLVPFHLLAFTTMCRKYKFWSLLLYALLCSPVPSSFLHSGILLVTESVFLPGWQGDVLKLPQYCSLFTSYSYRGPNFPLCSQPSARTGAPNLNI
jgi:hypothetical protein